jgi:hypothetical protein
MLPSLAVAVVPETKTICPARTALKKTTTGSHGVPVE